MLVKVFQIRMADKAIVFEFLDEATGENIGSRGVNAGKDFDEALFDAIVNNMAIAEFYKLKTEGFVLPNNPTTELEQVAKIAYDQFVEAKAAEERAKEGVIE